MNKKEKSKKEINLLNICFVMEYYDSDMDQLLKMQIGFSENHLIKIIYNSLCSLAFIHMCNVMHRDLKPANILLKPDCTALICDFGLSRTLPDSCSNRS